MDIAAAFLIVSVCVILAILLTRIMVKDMNRKKMYIPRTSRFGITEVGENEYVVWSETPRYYSNDYNKRKYLGDSSFNDMILRCKNLGHYSYDWNSYQDRFSGINLRLKRESAYNIAERFALIDKKDIEKEKRAQDKTDTEKEIYQNGEDIQIKV